MLAQLLFLASLAAAIQHPHLNPRQNCNANNCLRAVMHTDGHFSTRGGTVECSSFLATTITPATRTATVSITSSFTPTARAGVTQTDSTTTTPFEVQTQTTTTTTTVTLGNLGVLGKRQVTHLPTPVVVPEVGAVLKRQITNIPSQLPSYVSTACTGDMTSRYRSACSCLGVTPYAITAATPVQTITVTVSTSSTSTILTTVETKVVTITAATSSSTTFTTTTTTATATPTTAFAVQVVGGLYADSFLRYDPDFGANLPFIGFTNISALAALWNLDGTQVDSLTLPGRHMRALAEGAASYVFLGAPDFGSYGPLKCTIGPAPGSVLTCSEADAPTFNRFAACLFPGDVGAGADVLGIVGANDCLASGGGVIQLSLKAVPVLSV